MAIAISPEEPVCPVCGMAGLELAIRVVDNGNTYVFHVDARADWPVTPTGTSISDRSFALSCKGCCFRLEAPGVLGAPPMAGLITWIRLLADRLSNDPSQQAQPLPPKEPEDAPIVRKPGRLVI